MQELRKQILADPPPIQREHVRTGIEPLDDTMGGGIPKGDVLCVYSIPPVDDWPIVASAIKAAQEDGQKVFWVGAMDPDVHRWRRCGVDISRVLVSTCNDLLRLKKVADDVHILGADLFIIEGFSSLLNPHASGEEIGDHWRQQQNTLYELTRRRRLTNTSLIISRVVSEKYRHNPIRYTSQDDFAIFVEDHHPDRFKFQLMSVRSHIPSLSMTCKLEL